MQTREFFLFVVAQFLSRICLRIKADLFFCQNNSGQILCRNSVKFLYPAFVIHQKKVLQPKHTKKPNLVKRLAYLRGLPLENVTFR